MASIGSKTMLAVFDELNVLIEKVIALVIIPSITISYFWDFPKYDIHGGSCKSSISICSGICYDYCTAFSLCLQFNIQLQERFQKAIRFL